MEEIAPKFTNGDELYLLPRAYEQGANRIDIFLFGGRIFIVTSVMEREGGRRSITVKQKGDRIGHAYRFEYTPERPTLMHVKDYVPEEPHKYTAGDIVYIPYNVEHMRCFTRLGVDLLNGKYLCGKYLQTIKSDGIEYAEVYTPMYGRVCVLLSATLPIDKFNEQNLYEYVGRDNEFALFSEDFTLDSDTDVLTNKSGTITLSMTEHVSKVFKPKD